MKNILFGNEINIQYGGANKYSNAAIIKRLVSNIQSGKYDSVIPNMESNEILDLLNGIADYVGNIGKLEKYADGLFMAMEVDRIKKSYKPDSLIENIGFKNLFIILELISNKHTGSKEFRTEARRGLWMLFLDSIYDDGQINSLAYSDGLAQVLPRYDDVFTLNYDWNLERYCAAGNHLHGQFDMLAPEFDSESSFSLNNPNKCRSNIVVPGYEHMYCNAIMSWY